MKNETEKLIGEMLFRALATVSIALIATALLHKVLSWDSTVLWIVTFTASWSTFTWITLHVNKVCEAIESRTYEDEDEDVTA